jgi:hypothetical protein
MAKETWVYGKGELTLQSLHWQKRPICMAKETCLYGKGEITLAKETYLYGKRDLVSHVPQVPSQRTHSVVREHILDPSITRASDAVIENTFCGKRTHSVVREHILDLVSHMPQTPSQLAPLQVQVAAKCFFNVDP